ncbi:Flp family type IVb pilin [Sphingopyxis sp. 113P3]|jgi:Flp pilus assembly protein, pilin Flp|uniref:Flp family type IVb pilin n=1 Tax=Sphingopyxis sp. (strain 113P3) TaxID=292913 RepID=UPI0006BC2E9A|nr:Flp family type IVb pilin [Sphingopyxis sp. 113P3]ALC10610.1 Flp/Fap pilin protein [Sphingopyxis sp. 113P3]
MTTKRLINDQTGATAIEYGLLAALIAVASIVAFQMLGLNLATVFSTIASALGQ